MIFRQLYAVCLICLIMGSVGTPAIAASTEPGAPSTTGRSQLNKDLASEEPDAPRSSQITSVLRAGSPSLVTKAEANAALRAARSMLGVPYVWGGQEPTGFDCSGLVIWAYEQVAPGKLWRLGDHLISDVTAHDLAYYNVKPVAPASAIAGDLLFFVKASNLERATHVGFFVRWLDTEKTHFEWMHASSLRKMVVMDTWQVGKERDGNLLVGFGRMVKWSVAPAG